MATFGQATDPVTQVAVAGGLYDLAFAYARAGRFDLAITAGERLVGTYGESTDPEIRVAVSGGLCNLAFAYANAAQIAQAIATGERLLAMFGEAPEPDVQVAVARGLRDLAVAYAAAGRLDLSIAAGERLINDIRGLVRTGHPDGRRVGSLQPRIRLRKRRPARSVDRRRRATRGRTTDRTGGARGDREGLLQPGDRLCQCRPDRPCDRDRGPLIAAFGAAPEPEFRDVVERVMQTRALRNPTGLT